MGKSLPLIPGFSMPKPQWRLIRVKIQKAKIMIRSINTLMLICMTIVVLVKQALLFPQTVVVALKQRRR